MVPNQEFCRMVVWCMGSGHFAAEETLPLLHLLLEHFRHLAEVIPEEETLAEEEELRQPIQEVLLLLQPQPRLRGCPETRKRDRLLQLLLPHYLQ